MSDDAREIFNMMKRQSRVESAATRGGSACFSVLVFRLKQTTCASF